MRVISLVFVFVAVVSSALAMEDSAVDRQVASNFETAWDLLTPDQAYQIECIVEKISALPAGDTADQQALLAQLQPIVDELSPEDQLCLQDGLMTLMSAAPAAQ